MSTNKHSLIIIIDINLWAHMTRHFTTQIYEISVSISIFYTHRNKCRRPTVTVNDSRTLLLILANSCLSWVCDVTIICYYFELSPPKKDQNRNLQHKYVFHFYWKCVLTARTHSIIHLMARTKTMDNMSLI